MARPGDMSPRLPSPRFARLVWPPAADAQAEGAPRRATAADARPPGQAAHDGSRGRAGREDRRQLDARADQRAYAERGEAITSLVEGDDAACYHRLAARQFPLPEADRERQQRRAAQSREAKRGHGRSSLWRGPRSTRMRRRAGTAAGRGRRPGWAASAGSRRPAPGLRSPQPRSRSARAWSLT